MKRITILGVFVGLFSLTMNAQIIPTSGLDPGRTMNVESQNTRKKAETLSQYFIADNQKISQGQLDLRNTTGAADVSRMSFQNSQRTPQLPAAYFTNSTTTQGENAGAVSNGERNLNVDVPFTGVYYNNRATNAIIYDNGPHFNVSGTPNVSLLQSTALGMNTLGVNASVANGFSIADDVVLTEDYTISSLDVFAYQTSATAPSITAVYVRVWSGDPSAPGASIIWGNLTENVLGSAVYANANRYSETIPGDTSRKLNRVTAITTGLTLTAGTYWIEYSFAGSSTSGPWAPPVVILGQTTTGNAMQNVDGTWGVLEDSGTFTPQGLPFVLYGDLIDGGGDGLACEDMVVLNNSFENGSFFGGTDSQRLAMDIPVEDAFTAYGIQPNIIGVATNFNFKFYANNAGAPGAQIATRVGVIMDQEVLGNNFGFDFIQYTVAFDSPIDFVANTTYWIEIETDAMAWETNSQPSALLGGTDVFLNNQTSGSWVSMGEDNLVFSLICDDIDDGDGLDCSQGDDSNNFENGLNIILGGNYRNADDFMVSPDNTLNIRSIELNIIAEEPITSLNLNFYNNNNGAPGATILESLTALVPYAQVAVGTAFGYNVYAVFVEVDLNFEGGSTGTTYWMQPAAQSGFAFWETSTIGTLGAIMHTSTEEGAWIASEDGDQGVFKLYCDVVTPPPAECLFDISASVEPITRLLMANVDNASSASSTVALEDFTDVMIMVEAGGSYEVALEGNTGGGYTNYFTVFIDTSASGDAEWSSYETFEIGSINGSTGTDGQQATSTITIPASLQTGEYTLRVVKNYNTSPTSPCISYSFGQGEDYTLVVGDLEDCSGTPNGGVATVNPESGNFSSSYTVSATEYTYGNGITYQWQSNTAGAGWTNEGALEDHYVSFTATAPGELGIAVEWRLEITCVLSGETSYSEIATFTTVLTYCDATSSSVEPITRVVFAGIDNISSPTSSAGYEDFTAYVAEVQAGGIYSFEAEGNTAGGFTNYFTVWVDWNNNGVFDTDEMYEIGSIQGSTGTDGQQAVNDILVPVDAVFGNTRMRVRKNYNSSSTDPCGTNVFGQVEDYTVTVDGLVGTEDFSATDFTYYPNPMGDVLYITGNKDIQSISAYNVLGQKVLHSKDFANGKVDVSSLPTGAFMFSVTFESGHTEKFKVLKK